jgi:hypothetical protein
MMGLLVVGRSVPIRGIITAADLAAAQANPEVRPMTADFQALFTAGRRPMDPGLLSQAHLSTRDTLLSLRSVRRHVVTAPVPDKVFDKTRGRGGAVGGLT